LLASCSYDKEVAIWQDAGNNAWRQLHQQREHAGSVNAVAWAPWERGAILAACSSDGKISLTTRRNDDTWFVALVFDAH
jgi:protein transport protein SEC13